MLVDKTPHPRSQEAAFSPCRFSVVRGTGGKHLASETVRLTLGDRKRWFQNSQKWRTGSECALLS
jgi:hypothetical protein